MPDIIIIGHFSIDTIIINNTQWKALGGVPAYSQIIPKIRGNGGIVSIVGEDFPENWFKTIKNSGMDIQGIRIKGKHTTSFTNIYDDKGNRRQIVTYVAPKIIFEDFPNNYYNAKWIHIGPILNEIDKNTIFQLEKMGYKISIDPQGFLRKRLEDGRIIPSKWIDAEEILKKIYLLKCDEKEIQKLTGISDIIEAAKSVLRIGPKMVIITRSERGSIIFSHKEFIKIPAFKPDKIVDATGAGDTYMMGFIVDYLKTNDICHAGLFASAAASFNLETKGPTNFPTRDMIEKRMQVGKRINN